MVLHQLTEVEILFSFSSTPALSSYIEVHVALQGTQITLGLIHLAPAAHWPVLQELFLLCRLLHSCPPLVHMPFTQMEDIEL